LPTNKPKPTVTTQAPGLDVIEAVLGQGRPVVGLHLTTAFIVLGRSLLDPRYRVIKPNVIGTPAIVASHPGISQLELSRYLRCSRVAAGKQVAFCVKQGWLRREAAGPGRRYALYTTARGTRMLRLAASIIPTHEDSLLRNLSRGERLELRRLLRKLIFSS
jgi:DNA-binding MarR family transcriptional regulator